MADLEREGFGARLQRLLGEVDPFLPDFDGDRAAREMRRHDRAHAEEISALVGQGR